MKEKEQNKSGIINSQMIAASDGGFFLANGDERHANPLRMAGQPRITIQVELDRIKTKAG